MLELVVITEEAEVNVISPLDVASKVIVPAPASIVTPLTSMLSLADSIVIFPAVVMSA